MTAEASVPPDADEEAWNAALSYLSYRARSRRELERHLRRRGYEPSLVDRVLCRCERLDLLDDLSFATAFTRDRIRLRPRGVARLESELLARGVAREDARECIRAAFAEEEVSELDLLESSARRRWTRLAATKPGTARRRLYAYLVRAGFPRDEVSRVVAAVAEASENRGQGGAGRSGAGDGTDKG